MHRTVPRRIVSYRVSCRVVSRRVVPCRIVSYCVGSFCAESYRVSCIVFDQRKFRIQQVKAPTWNMENATRQNKPQRIASQRVSSQRNPYQPSPHNRTYPCNSVQPKSRPTMPVPVQSSQPEATHINLTLRNEAPHITTHNEQRHTAVECTNATHRITQYLLVHCDTARHDTRRYDGTAAQRIAAQHGTAMHSTTQHNTVQFITTQCDTIRYNATE